MDAIASDKTALTYEKSDPRAVDIFLSPLEMLLQWVLKGREETEPSEHIVGTVNTLIITAFLSQSIRICSDSSPLLTAWQVGTL